MGSFLQKQKSLFVLTILFIFLNACGASTGTTSSEDGFTGTISNIHDLGSQQIPLPIAKIESVDPTKISVEVLDGLTSSVSETKFLTAQTNCSIILRFTGEAGAVTAANTSTTPHIYLYNLGQGYAETYLNAVQSDGSFPVAENIDICAEAGDQVVIAPMTNNQSQIGIPVIFEIDNTGNVIFTITSSSNLAGATNILVDSSGDVYAIVVDGTGTTSVIYELKLDGSLGQEIASLSDIPITLDIVDVGTNTYLYYFNQNGIFKQLLLADFSQSISAAVSASPKTRFVTATEATIKDYDVTTTSNFRIDNQAQNDGNGSFIIMAFHENENSHNEVSVFRRQESGDISGEIQYGELNSDEMVAGFQLGKSYSYVHGHDTLDDCNFGAGCLVEVQSNDFGSFGDTGETSEQTSALDSSSVVKIFADGETNPVTQVITVQAEIDLTSEEQTAPNGLFIRSDGKAYFYHAETDTITAFEGDDFDSSQAIVKLATNVGSDGQSLIIGCRELGENTHLVAFVPSSDSALVDKIGGGTWEFITNSTNFDACSASTDINIGDNLNVYFYRTDSDGVRQMSILEFDKITTLQEALITIRPENE